MKKRCSLTCYFVLMLTFLLFIPTTSLANESSIGQTEASLTLAGWGDVKHPEPKKPLGPNGKSTLKETNKLPQTDEESIYILHRIGWLMIGMSLYLIVINKKNQKVGEGK
ncbi:hypothetical protein [Vagococcus xieshaowenii]|uniref:Gram-positive cocci surface proteins LPxTG domain-containing protein n=1 Tax=Vagococcus xieshaowenii TaxID=2562451 RepID=A0AAJ5EFF0_9ENTE|nr:hypothetical protein [Vagococcus xieshaowenii]QCA29546.1 hypothetical protein E4Z98_09515 [Vagococcus xieshaowenii]TFZ42662.1 hypothetical protein E4031_02915 [Vagococcus xieshaowenii]